MPSLGPHNGVPAGGCRNLLHARVRVHLQNQWQSWLSVKETCLTAIQLVNEVTKTYTGIFLCPYRGSGFSDLLVLKRKGEFQGKKLVGCRGLWKVVVLRRSWITK